MTSLAQAQQVLQHADLIYTSEQIHLAIEKLAQQINKTFENVNEPVIVMPIMNGGLILAGHLITRLKFPLVVDFVHATRYRGETTGSDLHWKVKPHQSIENRNLLLIDDIFDEGYTLEAVVEFCQSEGVEQVRSVVLVDKDHARPKASIKSDFVGLTVEDRYVFGFGMDYKGYHRNLDGIYAVSESHYE